MLQRADRYVRQVFVGLIVVIFAASAMSSGFVSADSYNDQIRALQQENVNNQAIVAQLQQSATSYQDAINRLQSQISILQTQIADSQARQNDLTIQILQQQVELQKQRSVLGESIRATYTDDQMTTIEMLASSRDLGEFVDKETYRNAVQQQIQDTMSRISKLQAELNAKKQEVDALLAQQQEQQTQLDASKNEQANLLAMNKNEQAAYNQKTQENKAKIASLIAAQVAANDTNSAYYFLRFPGTISPHNYNIDDYPYANAGFGMSTGPGCVDNDGPDRWGYCTRQCVSYTAWAVERSGRRAPKYYGSAKYWVAAAMRDGVPVYTSNPQPGDVAISTAGTWGHAMYVEKVDGNRILVSQYNQQLTGRYSTQWRVYQ